MALSFVLGDGREVKLWFATDQGGRFLHPLAPLSTFATITPNP
jgi:hypothetical protein